MAYDFGASRQKYINEMEQKKVSKANAEEDKGFDLGKALISPYTTLFDISEDVFSGVGKSLEGIVDYGLGLVGSAASIFGSNDIEKALSEAIKYDFTGNTIGKMDDWAEDSSWLSGDNWVSNTVHQVGQGVGGMLPGIAVTLATGGAAAPAALASMSGLLGTATFAAGAAGQSTEEALYEGANIGQATAFGTLTGATEGAIEYISGGLGGLNPFTKGAAGKILSGGAGKVFRSFAEEGLEEVASDLITPAWKAITYSGKYETPEINELIQSFTTGGLTALAMGGAGKATNMAMYGKDGEKALNTYNEILELNQEEYNLESKGKLTQEQSQEFAKKRADLVEQFGEQIKDLDTESKKYQRLTANVDIEGAKNFNVKKQAIYETVNKLNSKYKTNLKVEFVKPDALKNKENETSTIDGYIDNNTGKIYINEESVDPYTVVLAHEITHSTENNQLYNELSKDILSTMSQEELANKRNELSELYENATEEMLNKEIVADYVSKMLGSDTKTLIKTFTRKPNVVTKVLEWIESKMSNTSKNDADYEQYKELRDKIRNVLSSEKNTVENTTENDVELKRIKKENWDKIFNGEQGILQPNKSYNLIGDYNIIHKIDGDQEIVQLFGRKSFSNEVEQIVKGKKEGLFTTPIEKFVYQVNGNNIEIVNRISTEGLSHAELERKYGENNARNEESENAKRNGNSIHANISNEGQRTSSTKSVGESEAITNGVGNGISNGKTDNEQVTPNESMSRKRRKPPEGQMSLDLHTTQIVPVEENPIATIEEPRTFAETKEKGKVSAEEGIKQTSEQVKTKMPKTNQTVGEKIKTGKEAIDEFIKNRNDYMLKLQIQLTNSFAGIESRAKEFFTNKFTEEGLTGSELKAKVNEEIKRLKALELKVIKADAGANYLIKTDLYDGIWKEINEKGEKYTNLFETFLLHRLNVKRMRYKWLDPQVRKQLDTMLKDGDITQEQYEMLKEEAEHIEKKQLFRDIVDENGNKIEVTAEYSEEWLAKMEKEHPEFKELANKVYAYLDTLMQIRKQAGIVSQEQIDFMKEHYGGWYVPSYRDQKSGATTSGVSGKGKIGVTKGIHSAKGSDLDIQSIMTSMSKQTMGVYKQALMNELFTEVKKIAPDAFEKAGEARQNRQDVDGDIQPKKNEVYFYENGKRTTYNTTDDIAIAFETLRNDKSNQIENNYVAKGLEKLVALMKKWTTEYNPFFAVRNLFRDASDAFIYTKYSKNLIKRYNRALKEIRRNGKYYELYLRNGGEALSFFDKDNGIDLSKKNALLEKITYINEITELMPRLSEFMESIDAHYKGDLDNVPQDVLDMAMLDASEVTVNFARGGTLTKKLNKYLMPYLNASVQGWCKTWNTFVHPESMNAWAMSMAKITLMALPTLIFNEIFYDDDEEYQQLSDEVKGSYFLLKVGNNKFIRIPRGRVEAVMGDALQRTYRSLKGQENAFEGYVENTLKNVSPVDNLTRTILSPVTDVVTNTTWYGGQIENRSMQALPVQERYDQNTSAIAKVLAKLPLGVSPKKWHYLLDQYSGILGDVVLPLTSKNKDLSGLSGLTVNSLENNKYTNKFYDEMEKVEQQRNSENSTGVDKAKMRYFNKMNTKISELYKERKASDDKETQTAIQAMIVKLQKDTLEGAKEFEKVLKKYEYGLSIDELYEDYYRQATKECFGAEVALMDYDGRIYEKATIFNKCGINWDTFYNVYFDAQDIMADYDADGNVVSGSKKTKITNYVKSLNLTATQKYMVMGLLGYKNTNGEQQVRSLLRSKGYNGEELNKIMKMCGYN